MGGIYGSQRKDDPNLKPKYPEPEPERVAPEPPPAPGRLQVFRLNPRAKTVFKQACRVNSKP